jgi:hypothetical protein
VCKIDLSLVLSLTTHLCHLSFLFLPLPFLAPSPRLILTGWTVFDLFRQISNTHLIFLAGSLFLICLQSPTLHFDLTWSWPWSWFIGQRWSESRPQIPSCFTAHLLSPLLYCTAQQSAVQYRRIWNMIAAFSQNTDEMVRVSTSHNFTITPPILYLPPQHTDTARPSTTMTSRTGKRRHCDSIDSDTPPPSKKYKQSTSIASDVSTTSTTSATASIELDYPPLQTIQTSPCINTFLPAFRSVQYDRPAYRSISPTPPSPRSHWMLD